MNRAGRRQTSEFERGRIIGMMEAGLSISAVSRMVGRDRKTVRLWWTRFQTENQCIRKVGSGRPAAASRRHLHALSIITKRNRFSSVKWIRQQWMTVCGLGVCRRTVNRFLLRMNLKSYRPLVRTPLGPHHRRARLDWCRERIEWDEEWHSIMFTDESRFCLDVNDGRVRVRRLPGERFFDCCIREHDRYGGGSVMAWAGITWDGKTQLIRVDGNLTAQRYVDEIIDPVVVPYIRQQRQEVTFQQDNARPHTARVTQDALRINNVTVLPWPARSPDLSPIEHAWDILGRRVSDPELYPHPPATLDILWERLDEQWMQIPQQQIQRLISSMPRRVHHVRQKRGGHTRY